VVVAEVVGAVSMEAEAVSMAVAEASAVASGAGAFVVVTVVATAAVSAAAMAAGATVEVGDAVGAGDMDSAWAGGLGHTLTGRVGTVATMDGRDIPITPTILITRTTRAIRPIPVLPMAHTIAVFQGPAPPLTRPNPLQADLRRHIPNKALHRRR